MAPGETDWARVLGVYPFATGAEFALIAGSLRAVDAVVGTLPGFAVPPLFLFLSLRSRIFSPLVKRDSPSNATRAWVK